METWRRSFKIILSMIENICHSCKKKMIWMLVVYSSVKIVLKRFMIYEFGKNAKQVAKTEFGRDDRKPQNKQDGSFVAHIVLISSQEARHHSSSLPLILPQPKQGHHHLDH